MPTAKPGSTTNRRSKPTGSPGNTDGFAGLLPDQVVAAAETALGEPFTGYSRPCASYVNRVYELEAVSGRRVIIKFYRPGRWDIRQIREEHSLVLACTADEIPVIAPLALADGDTVGRTPEGMIFAVYPKEWGRPLEINSPEEWRRLGRLLGRMHNAGETVDFRCRQLYTPSAATRPAIERLIASGAVAPECLREFRETGEELLEALEERFDGASVIGVHGDCHAGNILDRPDRGLVLIDFDDCMRAPAVQDWWLLLPDHAAQCREELTELAMGYEDFRYFDWGEIELIEGLRAMRMIYYLDWCALQTEDFQFRHNHPDWGGVNFWRREIADLRSQLELI